MKTYLCVAASLLLAVPAWAQAEKKADAKVPVQVTAGPQAAPAAADSAPGPGRPLVGNGEKAGEQLLDPGAVKVGDKVKLVLKEINQRSGALVFTASKVAYGTVVSVAKVKFDGKENIIFEITPYGADNKTILKYDKKGKRAFRDVPTVKFGTLQIAKIFKMPPDSEMGVIANYADEGAGEDELDAKVADLGESRESVERKVQMLGTQVRTLRQLIADHEAAAKSIAKPPVARTRDRDGTARVDSAAATAAQEIMAERRNAEEAAIIRIGVRLEQKEEELRDETAKLASFGDIDTGEDPAVGRNSAKMRIKMLSDQAWTLRQLIADHEAAAKGVAKPPVIQIRDADGTARVDSAASAVAQEISAERRKREEASVIRLKARLAEKEREIAAAKAELAKLGK